MRQPICDPCWLVETGTFEYDDDGRAMLVWYKIPEYEAGNPLERCCVCNAHTIAGIYIDTPLSTVPYPQAAF